MHPTPGLTARTQLYASRNYGLVGELNIGEFAVLDEVGPTGAGLKALATGQTNAKYVAIDGVVWLQQHAHAAGADLARPVSITTAGCGGSHRNHHREVKLRRSCEIGQDPGGIIDTVGVVDTDNPTQRIVGDRVS